MRTQASRVFARFLEQKFKAKALSGGEYLFDCPECGKEEHCQANVEKLIGHCWVCGYSYSAVSFVRRWATTPQERDAVLQALFADKSKEPLLRVFGVLKRSTPELLHRTSSTYNFELCCSVLGALSIDRLSLYQDLVLRYLTARGVSKEAAVERGFRVVQEGFYAGRILIPVIYEGKVVSFVARDYTGLHKLKELSASCLSCKRTLGLESCPAGSPENVHAYFYNWDESSECEELFVVEGVFDALAVGKGAIASFGKTLSKAQERLLVQRRPKCVYFMRDPDALDASLESAQRLNVFFPTKVVLLPSDPDEVPEAELHRLIEQAKDCKELLYRRGYLAWYAKRKGVKKREQDTK